YTRYIHTKYHVRPIPCYIRLPYTTLFRSRVELAEDVVSIGEAVQAQVLSVEQNDKGLSIKLSLKALAAPATEKQVEKDEILIGKDRKSTRLNSSHVKISYAVFCLTKKR